MLTFLKELLSGNRRKGKRLEAVENEKNEPTLAELDEKLGDWSTRCTRSRN